MQNCVFCKIITNQIPSQIIEQTNNLIVIKDINPKASIHYLIIPKKHIKDIQSFENEDLILAAEIFEMAQKLSKNDFRAKDFKIVSNNGSQAGQVIFHFHMHFLAGKLDFEF